MQVSDSIKLLCLKYGISQSELARRLNKTPQSLSQKMTRGTISLDDLDEIAVVIGGKLDCVITLPSGEEIKINS